ncbi:MAG: IclR family transcriptional regulator [Deltaproteobacteria bacterium]|nr:IclR family transcriptional regulator [Deltaproteobacteria bacterium]
MELQKDYISVQKALQILLAFVPHNKEMGTMEVSELLGLNKSTVSRLLNVLVRYDFLQHDKKTRKFRLGKSAAAIGMAVKQSLSEQIIGIAQPYIDDLRNKLDETFALEIWNGDSTIMAYRAEALRLRRVSLLRPGDKVDVHVSAGARVILAFSSQHVIENILRGMFPKYTEKTITDSDLLKAQLPGIRENGYFIALGERHLESNIIAVPIFNFEKKPVAAISLFTITERLQTLIDSEVVSLLKQTASQISAKLLYSEED